MFVAGGEADRFVAVVISNHNHVIQQSTYFLYAFLVNLWCS